MRKAAYIWSPGVEGGHLVMDKPLRCLDPGSHSLVCGAVAAAWGGPSRLVFHSSLGGPGARSKVRTTAPGSQTCLHVRVTWEVVVLKNILLT